MAITVNSKSWHARVYRWWYNAKFGKRYDYETGEMVDREPERSNLCPYMRAVMFWSWMRWLFIGGRIGKVRVPIITWLFLAVEVPRWMGIVSYDAKMAIVCLYLAVVIGATGFASLMGILWLSDHTNAFKPIGKVKGEIKEFSNLTGEYLRAKHDRICPEITFRAD